MWIFCDYVYVHVYTGARLITAIENHPAIWDSSTPDYSDTFATKKAWVEICTQVDSEFNIRESRDKNILGKQLHRRWKSLRDCYRRELQKQISQKGDSPAIGRKCYVYFEQLRFLQTICTPTQSGLREIKNESAGEENQELENGEFVETDVPPETSRKRARISKEDDREFIQISKQTIAQEKSLKLSANNDLDPDTLFLLSLVPELKKMPENRKLLFKTQLLNTLLQAQNASESAGIDSTCIFCCGPV